MAFSGGVDSTLLLKVCRDVLGPANVTAVTGVSQTYTPEEKRTARRAARELGVRHVLIETDELACAAFAANPADRCYHCKRELFGRIAGLAKTLGIDAFYDASNVDDLSDYRPGRRATEEFGVVSPLVQAGFTKKDVRALSKRLGLASWDKPANPCLASRIPYGTPITVETLEQGPGRREVHPRPRFPRRQAPSSRRAGAHRGPGRRFRPDPAAGHGPQDRRAAEVARLSLDRARRRGLPHGQPQPGRREPGRGGEEAPMKVAVGMSGGVDSSVAALLLLRAGHEVSGVLMKLWPGPEAPAAAKSACYGPDEAGDIRAAEDVCARLGIPLRIVDCSRDYEELVLRYFREGYAAGTTPEPLRPLQPAGQVRHPARDRPRLRPRLRPLRHRPLRPGRARRAARAVPPEAGGRRGQGPILFPLPARPAQLAAVLFPLGELTKARVRAIAREAGLPVHDRKESQDFYGGDLGDIVGPGAGEGDIVDRDGRVLGRHRGVPHYTIGQRKGLGIASPVPLYVIAHRRRAEQARRRPGERDAPALGGRPRLRLGACSRQLAAPAEVQVKVRSGGRLVPATISPLDAGRCRVDFAEPVSAVAPGQSAVFYDGDTVVGGGVIESAA